MCIVHRQDETGTRRTASSWLRKRALWSNCTPHPWTKWIPRPLWPSREVSLDRSACSSTTQSRSSTCSAASLDASITRSRGRGDLSGRHGRGIDARATSETGETVTFHNRRENNWISLCVSSNPHENWTCMRNTVSSSENWERTKWSFCFFDAHGACNVPLYKFSFDCSQILCHF